MPDGAIIDNKFQDKSVEYIYEILLKTKKYEKFDLMINDILQPSSGNQKKRKKVIRDRKEMTKQLSEEEIDEIESFGAIRWKFKNADEHQLNNGKGSLPAGIGQKSQQSRA